MKIYYFDSSALVKRYHFEEGTKTVDNILYELKKKDEAVISYFAILEIVSALRRKLKNKEITKKVFDMAIATFLSEVTDYFSVRPIDEKILSIATNLVIEYGLRAADSLHLATAKEIADFTGKSVVFIASDKELLDIAALEKIETLDPEKS
ncbi:MAG: type II toxin-antitoxin system VapC family toxin [Thermoplasmata archaeon]|nr:MAG: type II toxin-antitoxin system VapC family toxin [Thermoplasmata archaeon]